MNDNKKGWFDDDPEWEDLKKRSENPPPDSKIDQWMDRFEDWLDSYELPWKKTKKKGSTVETLAKPQKKRGYFSDLNGNEHRYRQQKTDNPIQSNQVSSPETLQSQPTAKPDKVEVSINVTLPKFSKVRRGVSENFEKAKSSFPKVKRTSLSGVKKKYIVGVASIVIVAAAVPLIISQTKHKSGNDSNSTEEQATDDQKPNVAQFKVYVPKDGTAQARYDQDKQISSYQDTINGVNLTITQQALPEKFKINTAEEIKSFASSQNFKDSLAVDTGVAYVGMSAFGPQSVIYQKDQTLIFIQSVKKISNGTWIKYLNGLQ